MLKIAKILRSHGTDGGMLVSGETELEGLDREEPVWMDFDGLQTPFFITGCQPRGSRYILHLDGVTSLRDAEELVGKEILADVEEESDGPDFTGWKVFDASPSATPDPGKPVLVGTVTGDEPIPGNYCLYVRTKKGDEVLIPLHEDFILSADERSGVLVLDLPSGLY